MKVIITKYSLTSGPTVAEGELSRSSTADRPMFAAKGGFCGTDYYHGDDFQTTKEEAKAKVVSMTEARRKSLLKSLSKLDKARDKALAKIEGLQI